MSKNKKPFARKRFGQNFLKDDAVIFDILQNADVKKQDLVIEVGPGRGALTEHLIMKAGKVIAVEIDNDLFSNLKETFSEVTNLQLLNNDILKLDLRSIIETENFGSVKIVANLPYNISSPFFFSITPIRELFNSITVMLQKEVAQRLYLDSSNLKKKDYSALTVVSDMAFDVNWVVDVTPNSFVPAPKVDSAVISLIPKNGELADESSYFSWVRTCFSQKRKKIWPLLLKRYPSLNEMNLDNWKHWEVLRPDDIPPNEYFSFYKEYIQV